MRSRLVEPGVPNGTPAAMTIVCPGCANCSSSAVATARCVMSLTPLTSLHTTGLTPQGQCEPTRRLAPRRHADDGRARPLARHAQGRRARAGVGHHRGHVEEPGHRARGPADGIGYLGAWLRVRCVASWPSTPSVSPASACTPGSPSSATASASKNSTLRPPRPRPRTVTVVSPPDSSTQGANGLRPRGPSRRTPCRHDRPRTDLRPPRGPR